MNNSIVKFALLTASCLLFATACVNNGTQSPVVEKSELFPNFASSDSGEYFDADKIAALETRMKKFVSDGDTHGIASLLVKDGKIISHVETGIMREADNAPIAEDTIYRIYSMTKPVTGVAMMKLYEQGAFSLDDPVSKFIPEFAGLEVVKSFEKDGTFELEPLERQPTMLELMSHTAGFAYGLYGQDPSNIQFMKKGILAAPDLTTFIDKVATVPLMTQPGTMWFYSAAVDIQGAIIERISGMSLGEYFKQNIFKPLEMPDTGFFVPEADYQRFSDVWAYHPETKAFTKLPFEEAKYNRLGDVSFKKEVPRFESGGGGLVSTLGDYARFCQMLANGGELNGNRILNTESITLMRTNVLREDQQVGISGTLSDSESKAIGFGLNFGTIKTDGSDRYQLGNGSYFWGGAAGTWFWIDPVNNLYFIGMIQRIPQGGPEVDFRGISHKLVYGALK